MHHGTTFKGTLLVTGTTVGGGMLALPVLTSAGGFLPSLAIYFLCWLFMASTGLLFFELVLWKKKESNIISMAEMTLGRFGKIGAWLLYIFLFYCLTLAYVVGCGNLLVALSGNLLPAWSGSLLFVLLLAPLVYAGATWAGKINIFLMAGLAFFYVAFIVIGFRYVDHDLLLSRQNWAASLQALPVAFTAFAYQGIVPTLTTYLGRDRKKVTTALLIGSAIPLVTYIIWQWLILGIVPVEGEGGLLEALAKGETAVIPLKRILAHPQIYIVGQCFAFFALVTSFLGVTLGLIDFFIDGFGIEKTARHKFFICILIFVPILLIAVAYPDIFLAALGIAGGFGTALLLGLFPILMVWRGRYYLGHDTHQILPGGRLLLFLLLLFVSFEVIFEIFHLFVN